MEEKEKMMMPGRFAILFIALCIVCILAETPVIAQDTKRGPIISQYRTPNTAGENKGAIRSTQQGIVPNVVGMTYLIAKQTLEAAGFEVRTSDAFFNSFQKTVREQSLKPQQMAPIGTSVWQVLN
jgi:beta-lactam-binding protein with PASTA domain